MGQTITPNVERITTRLKKAAGSIAGGLGDLLFPPRCYGCGRDGAAPLCAICLEKMPRLGKPGCPICGRPETVSGTETILTRCGACRTKRVWFDLARSVAPYVGPAGNWIRMLKYGRKRRLGSALGQILAESLRSDPELAPLVEVDYVVPVPLHWLRAWWRGFNQSELLAQSICREWGLESGNGVLRRIRNDRKQVGLSGRRRWENVKGAFVVTRPEEVKGKRILLVDDVMTTGATLSECARVLKKAGAKTVCGLTLTRQVG